MSLWDAIIDPGTRGVYLPVVVAALAVCLMCSVLSVAVVLKRMSFIGQGVSHSALGGIGVAAVAGLLAAPGSGVAATLVVLLFAAAAGVAMAIISEARGVREDTAIGIVLVASMALGAVLLRLGVRMHPAAASRAGWESLLFGQIMGCDWSDALFAWIVSVGVIAALLVVRRSMLFWAFDEDSAAAFGVPCARMRIVLVLMLTAAVVVSMKIVGVVLASAMLVLPAAAGVQLSNRMNRVLGASVAAGLAGLLAGFVAAFRWNLQLGSCIVLASTALVAIAAVIRRLRR